MSSKETFARLGGAFEHMIKSLDRSILLDYCRRLEPRVYARYFKGYRPQTLGRKRITEALRDEVFNKQNEALADILVLLWNQAHREIYQAMLDHVKTIADDVETIERIEDAKAEEITADLEARFDIQDILICVCLNEVRFSPEFVNRRLIGTAEKSVSEKDSSAQATDISPEPAKSDIRASDSEEKNP